MKIVIKICVLLILVFESSCNSKNKTLGNKSKDSCQRQSMSINYPFINKGVLDMEEFYEWSKEKSLEKYKVIDKSKNSLFKDVYPLNQLGNTFDAWYYSCQNKVGGIQPIAVVTTADDYGAIFLVNYDSDNTELSKLQIAGGNCAGPYEDEKSGRVIWCDEKKAQFINDSIFNVIIKKIQSDDFKPSQYFIDSITLKYKITSKGDFEKLSFDSTSFVRDKR